MPCPSQCRCSNVSLHLFSLVCWHAKSILVLLRQATMERNKDLRSSRTLAALVNLHIRTVTLYVKQMCMIDFTHCNLLATPRFCVVVATFVASITRTSLSNYKLIRGWGLGRRRLRAAFVSCVNFVLCLQVEHHLHQVMSCSWLVVPPALLCSGRLIPLHKKKEK